MSRQLKFRVWDKIAKRFIKCNEVYQGHYSLSLKGKFYNLQNGSGDDDYIVQQFTGLKDKNGKEIYEGDIIQYQDGSYQSANYDKVVVEWMSEDAGYDYTGWKLKDTFLQGGSYKVIGNIFENPELLKA
jgi:uncharacterized phage protein (TIGR01671 family)